LLEGKEEGKSEGNALGFTDGFDEGASEGTSEGKSLGTWDGEILRVGTEEGAPDLEGRLLAVGAEERSGLCVGGLVGRPSKIVVLEAVAGIAAGERLA